MRLRWKKNPKVTGLASVCAGPRGSKLWDGEDEYASVNYSQGHWGNKQGWYWVSFKDVTGEHRNTCDSPVGTEKEAKAEAMTFVKNKLALKDL